MRPFGRGFSRDGDLQDYKDSVRVATIAALAACTAAGAGFGKTLTADANGTLTVDGVLLVAGDRVLVKNQVAGADNGIYVVTAAGVAGGGGSPWILTRAVDFDDAADVTAGATVPIEDGTLAEEVWQLATNNPITLDTTVLTFAMGPAGFVPITRTLTAGSGLTGGGALSADRTFAVGAGTGITVNADDVAVDQATAFAWTGDHSWGLSAAAAAGVDSRRIRFIGQTSAGLRNIDIINEADAGTDTYRLQIKNNLGASILNVDQSGFLACTYVWPTTAGSVTIPTFGFNGSTGFYLPVASTMGVTCGGVESARFATNLTTLTGVTDVDASAPVLDLYHNRATPTGGDTAGILRFSAKNDTPAKFTAAEIRSIVVSTVAASEDARLDVYGMVQGALTLGLSVGSIAAAGAIGLGFFGTLPQARPAALVQTYATADRTLANDTAADLGAFTGGVVGFLDAAERDNVRTQFNALRVDVDDLKQFVNSLVDDLQTLGLEQ